MQSMGVECYFILMLLRKKGEFSISIQVIEYRTMGFISFIPLNFNWYKPVTNSCKFQCVSRVIRGFSLIINELSFHQPNYTGNNT